MAVTLEQISEKIQPLTGREYYVFDPSGMPQTLRSVTTILGLLPKPHLDRWKLSQVLLHATHPVILAQMEEVNAIPAGPDRNRAVAVVAAAAIELSTNEATSRGTAVHADTELHDAGLPVGDSEFPGHIEGYKEALAESGIKFFDEYIEHQIVSFSGNRKYSGRADRFCQLPGDDRLVVYDVKTSKAVSASTALQLAAYANAEFIYDSKTQTLQPFPSNVRRDIGVVAWVREDKTELVVLNLEGAWEAFSGLCAVNHWQSDCEHRTIGRETPSLDVDTTHDLLDCLALFNDDELAELRDRWPAHTAYEPPWSQLDQRRIKLAIRCPNPDEVSALIERIYALPQDVKFSISNLVPLLRRDAITSPQLRILVSAVINAEQSLRARDEELKTYSGDSAEDREQVNGSADPVQWTEAQMAHYRAYLRARENGLIDEDHVVTDRGQAHLINLYGTKRKAQTALARSMADTGRSAESKAFDVLVENPVIFAWAARTAL